MAHTNYGIEIEHDEEAVRITVKLNGSGNEVRAEVAHKHLSLAQQFCAAFCGLMEVGDVSIFSAAP